MHVHPRQESSVEVVSGSLRFVVDGTEHRLGPGDALTIPAGVPHNFVNDGNVDAVAMQAFRPALRTEAFFRVWFDLSRRGEIGASGMPSLLRLAVLAPEFGDEIRVARPPWLVQRAVFALLAPVARLRGYRAAVAPSTAPAYARAARRASRSARVAVRVLREGVAQEPVDQRDERAPLLGGAAPRSRPARAGAHRGGWRSSRRSRARGAGSPRRACRTATGAGSPGARGSCPRSRRPRGRPCPTSRRRRDASASSSTPGIAARNRTASAWSTASLSSKNW